MASERRIAMVTGAASGIGLATSLRLLRQGHEVLMVDVRAVQETARAAHADAGTTDRAHALQADVSDPASVATLFQEVARRFGRLDILVNNAGIDRRGTLDNVGVDDIDAVLAVNLRGTILVSRAAIPLLRASGGTIVNVASELGLVGAPGLPVYVASKGGVVQLTKALAIDHAADGIRVNCICPGATMTPLLQASIDSAPDPAARRRLLDGTTLMGRVGRPEEIANVICFVASDEASFMTGSIVAVDGGATAA